MTTKIAAVPDPEDDESYDPFDPENLQAEAMAMADVSTVLSTVPVRRPDDQEWFRVHPTHATDATVLNFKTDKGFVAHVIRKKVDHLVTTPSKRMTRLFLAMSNEGVVFIWPVKWPIDGNQNSDRVYNALLQAADQAKDVWTRVYYNTALSSYERKAAAGDYGEPQWPDKSFRDLLELAFRGNVVDKADHPVIRRLNGEI